jgi:hypothetical protein
MLYSELAYCEHMQGCHPRMLYDARPAQSSASIVRVGGRAGELLLLRTRRLRARTQDSRKGTECRTPRNVATFRYGCRRYMSLLRT